MAGTVDADPVFQSVSAVALRDGLSRAAVSKSVCKLVERHALEVRRTPNGKVLAFNVVQYDRLRGTLGDSAMRRTPAASSGGADAAPVESLDEARRVGLLLTNEQRRLELAESQGRLVRRDLMADAVTRLGEEMGREIDLTQHADRIAAAWQKAGLHGLRIELKAITREMATALADHCARVAMVSPALDAPLPESAAA